MNLIEIVEKLQLTVKTGAGLIDKEIKRGYVSDLMSDVMANADEGDLWVTLQIHQNIVAVAVMKSLGGIILINGREPEKETLQKAEAQGLPLMVTDMPAFELVGKLFALGVSGS